MRSNRIALADKDALAITAFAILKAARKRLGISVCRAAQKAHVPVFLLYRLEQKPSGHCTLKLLSALSNLYGISMLELFKPPESIKHVVDF